MKVGVSFTRFQTTHFDAKFAGLDARVISYGPCQTPTLGFVVDRHDLIQAFESEPRWSIECGVTHADRTLSLRWARGSLYDERVAQVLFARVRATRRATMLSCERTPSRRMRPLPLNTVTLLQIASRQLGIGPQQTMSLAERLYTDGFISYPRTESAQYAASFDVRGALQPHTTHAHWGEYVRSLLDGVAGATLRARRDGDDCGDHPPITPTDVAHENDLWSSAAWRLYDYITRHFIATVSPDAEFEQTHATFDVGGERFELDGRRATAPGFTLLMPWLVERDVDVPSLDGVTSLPIAGAGPSLVKGEVKKI